MALDRWRRAGGLVLPQKEVIHMITSSLKKASVGAVGVLGGEALGRIAAQKTGGSTWLPITIVTGVGYLASKRGGILGGLGTGAMVNGMIHTAAALAARFGFGIDSDLRNF